MNNYYQLMATVKSKNYYTFVNMLAKATISYSIFYFELFLMNDSLAYKCHVAVF